MVDPVLVSAVVAGVGGVVGCVTRVAAIRARVRVAQIAAEGMTARVRALPPGAGLEETAGGHRVCVTRTRPERR
ncbi:hypothetical protein RM780_24245 [Streptomyces sp. DSM 44917]|uniref:Lipoprotein n=1 Tax=Streptomyces boetiae TaxID=3075541 RepID=A0ABU2LEM7_9ACTN|nr:hypothetical protein [Streptomyces sp. DSM 44917]MDT0310040.1 hypothetical protein [Streptomyces sp. DSM 44917]